MSNPARAPKELTAAQAALSNVPSLYLGEGFSVKCKELQKLENINKALHGLDMGLENSVIVPREYNRDRQYMVSARPIMALAKKGGLTARTRSNHAMTLLSSAYPLLPESGVGGRAAVAERMSKTGFFDCGAQGTLARLAQAYPKVGAVPREPVTRGEARAAAERCGVVLEHLPVHALKKYPLLAAEGLESVTINPKSENGFPVGAKWTDPGAAEMCLSLAQGISEELARSDAERWVREAEKNRPHLVLVKGKAKADYYTEEKAVGARLRFYNVLPRQVVLIMQQATQVLERHSRSILDDSSLRSGIGITLTRGGAEDLVEALEAQLREHGFAYVHVGDDSWVVMREGEEMVMLALDCSNFDLTQHGAVTKTVHEEVRGQLRLVDRASADLWYAFARERICVVAEGVVRRFKHAGPSGMPLQSKVNDMLMDVMLDRLKTRAASLDEEHLTEVVERIGRGMGFSIKLEQYWRGPGTTVREALEQNPFLFIGYYFHMRGGKVAVMCDVPRTFAQVPYPALKWVASKQELQVMEAMRLGSISLNLGVPTYNCEAALAAFRRGVVALIERTIAAFGDRSDPLLRWAVQESPWGAATEPSLRGLLRAVQRDAGELWLSKEVELPGTSTFVSINWADEVEADEAAVGGDRPAPAPRVRTVRVPERAPPTHPATLANSGRPPPTARWAPDRAPRPDMGVRADRAGGRRRGPKYEVWKDEYLQTSDEESEDYY